MVPCWHEQCKPETQVRRPHQNLTAAEPKPAYTVHSRPYRTGGVGAPRLSSPESMHPQRGLQMAGYTVVITPDDDDVPGGRAQATIRVETGSTPPRITEIAIRSTAPGGLSVGRLPSMDLQAVVAALSEGVRAISPDSATTVESVESTSVQATSIPSPSRVRVQPAKSFEGEQTALIDSAPERMNADSGRPYRRMPAADELRSAFEKIGTVTGLAEHYGVPRYTAQGWMRRLRKMVD